MKYPLKNIAAIMILAFALVLSSSFVSIDGTDSSFCRDVKKITTALSNKEFSKLKGKVIGSESANDESYESAIILSGYISQIIYDNETEISFAAVLNQDHSSAEDIQQRLEEITGRFKLCFDTVFEYTELRSSNKYSSKLKEGVTIEVSAVHPTEKGRYINISFSMKK